MTFNLKDLPISERPRERLFKFGASSLSLQELFELIFSQGGSKFNVSEISRGLLSKYNNLEQLYSSCMRELCQVPGIGKAKASQLHAAIELGKRLFAESSVPKSEPIFDSNQAFNLALSFLKNKKKEHLMLFSLDSRFRLIAQPEILSIGTLDSSLVHPREVFNAAIKNCASQIMLAHNHPSGCSDPSSQDFEATKNIASAGKIIGIYLLDHIVIGSNSFTSIRTMRSQLF